MGGFFGLTGAVLSGAALFTDAFAGRAAALDVLFPIAGCVAFSYWCFRAAAKANRRT